MSILPTAILYMFGNGGGLLGPPTTKCLRRFLTMNVWLKAEARVKHKWNEREANSYG